MNEKNKAGDEKERRLPEPEIRSIIPNSMINISALSHDFYSKAKQKREKT